MPESGEKLSAPAAVKWHFLNPNPRSSKFFRWHPIYDSTDIIATLRNIPFAHITAWTVVVCTAFVVLGYVLSGNKIALSYFPVAFVGFLLFVWQISQEQGLRLL